MHHCLWDITLYAGGCFPIIAEVLQSRPIARRKKGTVVPGLSGLALMSDGCMQPVTDQACGKCIRRVMTLSSEARHDNTSIKCDTGSILG